MSIWVLASTFESSGMIPLLYTLRKGIRLESHAGSFVVISEVPLNVMRVSERATGVLHLCDGTRRLDEIAAAMNMGEEQVFRLCNYFNKRAILEVEPAADGDYFPHISVIIPTRDRRAELAECLGSVVAQDYPEDKVEIIVVDDGSRDGTAELVSRFPCRLLTNRQSLGQSYCRNLGAKEAHGDILAFLDSDCVAENGWLRNLIAYFTWERVGLVGGFVDGYFVQSALDRYEKVCSSLNMGRYVLYGSQDDSTMYVPTCNMLVRSRTYHESGGITEYMHVGEDVDLCWRVREMGQEVFYIPAGAVKHKHRSNLAGMLLRKAQYGTSEALLYKLHPRKRKVFQVPPPSLSTFIFAVLAISVPSAMFLAGILASLSLDAGLRAARISRLNLRIPAWKVVYSVLRTHVAFTYVASFHLVRYYLVLLLLCCFVHLPLGLFGLSALLFTSLWDYRLRKPELSFPMFLCYYAVEHIAYQLGVLVGCLKEKTFMSYLPKFTRKLRNSGL
jgi:mycofactocin system glycosyltransferase